MSATLDELIRQVKARRDSDRNLRPDLKAELADDELMSTAIQSAVKDLPMLPGSKARGVVQRHLQWRVLRDIRLLERMAQEDELHAQRVVKDRHLEVVK